MFKRLFQLIMLLGVFGVSAGVVVLVGYYNEIRHEVDAVIDYRPPLTTQLFDRNGELVANLFEGEHRLYARIDEIPPRLIEALLAIEDTLFFEHEGINLDAILRAFSKNIEAGRIVEGASTITQQLIKNTLLTREKTIDRKLKEALLSLHLESMLTKEQILERYLNETFYGHGYYGIKTAAQGYFHKELDKLTLKEIAILVGLPRAPTTYNPVRNYEIALGRANKVLFRLQSLGWIDEQEFHTALSESPKVYDTTLTQNRSPYLVDMVLKELSGKYPDLRNGGYTITLNLDLEMQEMAQKALEYGHAGILERTPEKSGSKGVNGAMVVLEPSSGAVLTLLGGLDYRQSSFNRAVMSKRQPGSSFKPFIYQTALNLGYSTMSKIADISRTYEFARGEEAVLWQPENYGKKMVGLTTLQDAVVHSMNLATINLVSEIGLGNLLKSVEGFGFEGIPRNLSIALGSFGISPLQMSEMYTLFSAYGVKSKAQVIRSITDREGRSVVFAPQSTRLEPEKQAFLMVDTLREAVLRGTGKSAKVEGLEIAGKTGTTNENVDAWFCGFSPSVQAVVWYGRDDNTPMAKSETGGRAPATAFHHFFAALLQKHPELKREFTIPEGVQTRSVGGAKSYFTDISLPPKETLPEQDEKLLF